MAATFRRTPRMVCSSWGPAQSLRRRASQKSVELAGKSQTNTTSMASWVAWLSMIHLVWLRCVSIVEHVCTNYEPWSLLYSKICLNSNAEAMSKLPARFCVALFGTFRSIPVSCSLLHLLPLPRPESNCITSNDSWCFWEAALLLPTMALRRPRSTFGKSTSTWNTPFYLNN